MDVTIEFLVRYFGMCSLFSIRRQFSDDFPRTPTLQDILFIPESYSLHALRCKKGCGTEARKAFVWAPLSNVGGLTFSNFPRTSNIEEGRCPSFPKSQSNLVLIHHQWLFAYGFKFALKTYLLYYLSTLKRGRRPSFLRESIGFRLNIIDEAGSIFIACRLKLVLWQLH